MLLLNGPTETWHYRAMYRHLRRHEGCRPWKQVMRLFKVWADPQQLAHLLHTDRRAMWALAEMLLNQRMEPEVRARRWPCRNPWRSGAGPLYGQLAPAGLVPGRDPLPGAPDPLSAAAWRWIEYHAAAHVMLSLWRESQTQASGMASAEHAKWHLVADNSATRCDWSVQVQQDGSLRFSGVSVDDMGFHAQAMSERRADKSARRAAWSRAQQARWQHVLVVCSGPCLSWTPRDGGYVCAAARPTAQAWRRHRLLGVTGVTCIIGIRPQFWLFHDGAQFTARLCTSKLQTFGATAGDAIDALRQCLPAYIRGGCFNAVTDSLGAVSRSGDRHAP